MKNILVSLLVLWVATPQPVFAATVSEFVEACQAGSKLELSVCECTAEKARQRLSPEAFDFVAAGLRKDDQEAARLRGRLSFTETMAAGTFMATAPGECAGGPGGHAH